MALIRRTPGSVAVGRAAVAGNGHFAGAPAQPAPAPVSGAPQAGAPTSGGPLSGGPHPGAAPASAPAPSQPSSGQPGAQPHPPEEMAASAPTQPAHPWAVLSGLAAAVLGGFGAMGVTGTLNQPVFEVAEPTAAFGMLLAFATAVERLLEPISRWMPGKKEQAWLDKTTADMENGVRGAIGAAAQAKAAVDRARASRGVLMWGIATGVASVASSGGGFYILHALAADPGWNAVPRWVDAIVTGLVVGSGTKPVHDLINRAQTRKENATAA